MKPLRRSRLLALLGALAIVLSISAAPAAGASPIPFTILHTNDFHGNLELAGSNPGMARLAGVVNGVRASVGAGNVLLVDAGDEMQGSLLSNLKKGEPTIAVYKTMGYDVATFGNHEFDWGQTVLSDRVTQASSVFPYVSANIVKKDTADCSTAGWTPASFVTAPYVVQTVGTAPNQVKVGFIGVTTTETPYITIATATAGLCFKDPAESIIHYYDAMKTAGADVIVVLSHLGYPDGGYGYGFKVYGDQTLATKLNDAGKPVPLIIGGHSHTKLTEATMVGTTAVVQAYYAGRQVGQADMTFDPTTKAVSVTWKPLTVSTTGTEDSAIKTLIGTYTGDPAYQTLVNQEIGWTKVPIVRNYNGDSLMGAFVNDAIYKDLNTDATSTNDVDMVFNNPGGLRADIACDSPPCKLTYGTMFSVLPFGNQTVVGNMTGFQIMELLNQSAALNKGAIQVAGIRYKFFNYKKGDPLVSYAWGAFDACVINKTTSACDPLDLKKTYRVATNEFLAPAGQDTFLAFKGMANISYWGDMLNLVDDWVGKTYTSSSPFAGTLDGRITRDGTDAGGTSVPVTVTDGIAPGVNRGTTGFGTASVVVPAGTYVTFLAQTDKALAGQVVEIWTKTKTTDWAITTKRLVAADGTVHYYARVSAWTGFWAKYASAVSHGRIGTAR